MVFNEHLNVPRLSKALGAVFDLSEIAWCEGETLLPASVGSLSETLWQPGFSAALPVSWQVARPMVPVSIRSPWCLGAWVC